MLGYNRFIRIILKTINVPVLLEERCGHAMPHFVYDKTHEFYLSHADDPYNALFKHNTPQFIQLELIINRYKFAEWFNKDLPRKLFVIMWEDVHWNLLLNIFPMKS
jgi:hypothetical protein